MATNRLRAIEFWTEFNQAYQNERVSKWIKTLESGKGDWFRNGSLIMPPIGDACRIGRLGYDDDKEDQLVTEAQNLAASKNLGLEW